MPYFGQILQQEKILAAGSVEAIKVWETTWHEANVKKSIAKGENDNT